jgi:hypothetical protein
MLTVRPLRLFLVVLAVLSLSDCARRPLNLTPDQLAFDEVPADESGIREDEAEMDITIPAFNPLTSADPLEQINARFRGAHRRVPKTTITSGAGETFATLRELIADLPDDDDMLNHTPPVRRDTMTRATEERRNVRVTAWIYAITYEVDQDWHIILGTRPNSGTVAFFNAEVSGLPANAAAAFSKLSKVRRQLAVILDNRLPGGNYRKYKVPIPVVVEGSLFFDVDHAAGAVGPDGMEPDTAWEIHPITNLELQ